MPNRIVLVGTGSVGMAYAYALVNQAICDELVLIDIDETRSRADVLDLNHAEAWAPAPVSVSFGDYRACHDAAMVVICAGAAQRPGQTRLDLLDVNLRILSDVVANIMAVGFDGILVVATNPVDILTKATVDLSGLPRPQVLGTGTTLDTARLRFHLSQLFDVSTVNVHALVIGEHGDSEVPVWSSASVAGRSITRRVAADPDLRERLDGVFHRTRDAAYEIIDAKGVHILRRRHGPGSHQPCSARQREGHPPVSVVLDGEYGLHDVALGVPTIISRGGARHVVELDLDDEELAALHRSAATLTATLQEASARVQAGRTG